MSFKGYVDLEDTLYFLFTSRRFSTGAPYTLAGTPAVSVYEENNATQITAGVSLSADYDSVTGLNQVTIAATASNGYEAGKRYDVVITTGTVDSVSVVGEVVGSFVVGNVSADVKAVGGGTQSATDLKDFADTGYNPSTHKVAGVVLTDTCTANSDMRGTDNAALASVLGALADVAAAGDPTNADTVMQYLKQLINVLVGTDGVATFPAESAPGDAVSLAEVLRAIHADVTGLNGSAMRGTDGAALAASFSFTGTDVKATLDGEEVTTDSASRTASKADISTLESRLSAARAGYLDNLSAGAVALASVCTEARLGELGSTNLPADIDTLIARLTAARAGYIDNLNPAPPTAAAIKTAIEAVGSHLALIKAVTDALTAAAAAKLALSAGQIVTGTVSHDNTAATTTVFYADDITEATADHYNGRIVIFTSGALAGQATDITDYALVSGEGKFTVTALTEAPADNATFIIV